MLLDLTEVLSQDGKILKKTVLLEMDAFQIRTGRFPLIRKSEKCIKCMRCVQVCDKVQGLGIWDVEGTGSRTTINVSGLKTIEQADCSGADVAVIPDNMLREFGDVFLDNIAAADVERALGVPLIVVSHSGSDLVSRIAEHFRMEEKK